jgi:DNA helicase II / ATP-dependent DNA helicase PcrA
VLWQRPRVEHTIWGMGSLVKREGEGETAKLTVNFPVYGEKKLVANHPDLKLEE